MALSHSILCQVAITDIYETKYNVVSKENFLIDDDNILDVTINIQGSVRMQGPFQQKWEEAHREVMRSSERGDIKIHIDNIKRLYQLSNSNLRPVGPPFRR